MVDRPRRVAVVLKRASLLDSIQPRLEKLHEDGCAIHLALQDVNPGPARDDLAALWARGPSISIGYAVPRRDRWTEIARRYAETQHRPMEDDEPSARPAPSAAQLQMRAALPADPGILTYLRELDLDLVILTDLAARDGGQFDYLLACRSLNIATEVIEPAADDAADSEQVPGSTAAVQPGRPADAVPAPAHPWRAALWAVLLGGQLSRLLGLSDRAGRRKSLLERAQDIYVQGLFPRLIYAFVRLLPGTHPVLLDMSRQLSPAKLGEMLTIEAAMADACKGSGPIIFGPWTEDIATELLFWVPFVRWYRRRYKLDRDRIVVVSRDDTRSWYEGVGGRYLDIGELYSVEDVAALNAQRAEELSKRNKQYAFTRADQIICRKVAKRLSAARLNVLHPRTMHALFERYMKEVSGHAYVAAYTRYQPLTIKPAKVRQLCPGLPDRYVAVGFQFNESFPETKANRAFAVRVLRQITEKTDVVLVGSGAALKLGDLVNSPRIHPIKYDPRRALNVHSAIIAGAQAFVGAYDGLAYVAANLGRPVIGFESQAVPAQSPFRNIVAREFSAYGGSVTLLRTTEVESLGWLLACALGDETRAAEPAVAADA